MQRHYGEVELATVGFSYPEGSHGWLVDHGHRMVTGGTVKRLIGARRPARTAPASPARAAWWARSRRT